MQIEVYRSPVPGLIRLAILIAVIFGLAKYASEQVIALVQFVLNNRLIWLAASIVRTWRPISCGVVALCIPWIALLDDGRGLERELMEAVPSCVCVCLGGCL